MSFLRYRKLFYASSLTLVAAGIVSIFVFGLSFSNEFTGGSLLEIEFVKGRPEQDRARQTLESFDPGGVTVQPSGERSYIMRFRSVDEAAHQHIVRAFNELGGGEILEHRFEAVGPSIGRELRIISIWTSVTALGGIFLYLFFAFRKVPSRLGAHKFASVVIVTLLHDVVITLGLISLIGRFTPLEFGVPALAAFLVVAGYSINDTIIVFDRIREQVARQPKTDLETQIDQAIFGTLRRSLFTSVGTLLALVAILVFGGDTLKVFALALIIGIVIGTYSSIAVASPLLYTLARAPLVRREQGSVQHRR